MEKHQFTPKSKSLKVNFTLKSENYTYDFTLMNKEEELTFKFEDLKSFPVKFYELKIEFEKLIQIDENFFMFRNAENFVKKIKASVEKEKYSVEFDKDENAVIFEIKNEIFENDSAKIKIPEQEQDINYKI